MVSRSFFLAFFFTEERTCWHGGILGDAAVVAFTTSVLAGKHGLGTFGILGKFHVFLDGKRMGHCFDIKVVGTDEGKGPALFLQLPALLLLHIENQSFSIHALSWRAQRGMTYQQSRKKVIRLLILGG